MYAKLQYISQGATAAEHLSNIQSVLDAGCQWVQLRFKKAEPSDLLQLAEQVKTLTASYQATFIMNDHVEIAKAVDADGVHLGLLDTSIELARSVLGKQKTIGGTANTLEDVQQRIVEGCDYIGLGPYRFTSTKEKLSPILGLEGIAETMGALRKQGAGIPVYAIGGIEMEDLAQIEATGVYGIAVSGLITKRADQKDLIAEINRVFR